MPTTRHRAATALLAIYVLSGCLISGARGDVFHVSPSGNDAKGDGSNENPMRTINKALGECSAGDTVMVHKGVYRERVSVEVSGTKSDGWITLMGEEGAVLSGKGLKGGTLLNIEDQNYVRVLNLAFEDNQHPRESYAILVEGECRGIQIRKCSITRCKGKNAVAIAVHGTSAKNPIADIVIEGNTITECEPAPSEALALNGNVTDFAVTGNTIRNVNNIGIDFIGGEKDVCADTSKVARRGVCRGNVVENARSNYGGGFAAGIYVDGGAEITVEDNTVSGCDLGIEIGAENAGATAKAITVQNNRLHHNHKAGLVFGGYEKNTGRVTGCTFTGNILYHNTPAKDAEAELWIQHAAGNTVKNNTIWAAQGGRIIVALAEGADNTLDENAWFSDDGETEARFQWAGEDGRGFAAYQKMSGKDSGSTFAKPAFPDPDKGDFGSRAGEPASPNDPPR
jgi:parallel beta-helix repeat protein